LRVSRTVKGVAGVALLLLLFASPWGRNLGAYLNPDNIQEWLRDAGLTRMTMGRFALATGLGMLPLTALYNSFGSAITFGTSTTALIGGSVVLLFFLIPRWIERDDPFSLSRHFTHEEPGGEA
jgi:uncharacterized membrane protein YdjX (TVP38/TMEM64 family)